MDLVCEQLNNMNGLEVKLLNLGAAITSVSVPDPNGGRVNLVLGYGNTEDYTNDQLYFGSTPGRYANRIGRGRFGLNGREYTLTLNEGRNHLHGGVTGFAKQYWQADRNKNTVVFSYVSEDGENGYPGTLNVTIAYSLNDDNELAIKYSAMSDADTVINLTNHAYFNLCGVGQIMDHYLCLNADSFVVLDPELIPTGEIYKAAGGVMDFSSPRRIGDAVLSDDEAIKNAGGIDACYVIRGEGLRCAAVLSEPVSGRMLEVYTDLPGLQVYTGQWIPAGTRGRDGLVYGPLCGVCLEAQNFPDAPNRPEFPPAVLKAGEAFSAAIIYRFIF